MIAITQERKYNILHYNTAYDYCVIDADVPTVCHFDNVIHVELESYDASAENFNFMFHFFNYKKWKDEKDALNDNEFNNNKVFKESLLESIELSSLLRNEVQRWKNYMEEHDPDEFNRLMDIERSLTFIGKKPVKFVASDDSVVNISQKDSIADRNAKWDNITKVIDNIVENLPQEHDVLTALEKSSEVVNVSEKDVNYLIEYDIGVKVYERDDIIFKDSVLLNEQDNYFVIEDGLNISTLIKRIDVFKDDSPCIVDFKSICNYFQKTQRLLNCLIKEEGYLKVITKSKLFYDVKYNSFCVEVYSTIDNTLTTAIVYDCWNNTYNSALLRLNVRDIKSSV